jgi:hypothetical protein
MDNAEIVYITCQACPYTLGDVHKKMMQGESVTTHVAADEGRVVVDSFLMGHGSPWEFNAWRSCMSQQLYMRRNYALA